MFRLGVPPAPSSARVWLGGVDSLHHVHVKGDFNLFKVNEAVPSWCVLQFSAAISGPS